MPDIKTLDQRIREEAQKKLQDQIEVAKAPLTQLLRWSSMATIPTLYRKATNGDIVEADQHYVIDQFCRHLFAENVERAERTAIEDFMARVESLQQQVNDLRSLSHEHD